MHGAGGKAIQESDPIIPIVCCAEFSEAPEIIIHDEKDSYYELPNFVEQNFSTLISAHRSSKIYNNLNVRVRDWKISDNKLEIQTERTFYLSSMATNRAMDFKLEGGLTIRKVFGRGSKLVPLSESRLSNHLGVNGMIESLDGMCPLVYRKKNVSIGKGTYGNSVGASLKTKYALTDGLFTKEGLFNAIRKEIVDELGIEEKLIGEIKIINAYREIVEGGKPQLFFYVRINRNYEDIQKEFMNYQMAKHGNDEAKMQRDGNALVWVKADDIRDHMLFYADHVTSDVVSFKAGKPVKSRHNMAMLPSTSGCMLFLQRYFAGREKK